MNAINPDWKWNAVMAEVPLLDWRGPQFLMFYGAAFLLALLWSLKRKSALRRRFDASRDAGDPVLEDPYEAAFLAGGLLRCAQVAVVRLMEKQVLEWKPGRWLSGGRLAARQGVSAEADLNDIERAVFQGISAKGQAGVRIDEVIPMAKPMLPRVEAKLARMGLRPTDGERSGLGLKAVLPMLLLAGLGVLKLVIGLTRGKPVVMLGLAIFLTLIIALILASSIRYLTPSGERILQTLRRGREGIRTATAAERAPHELSMDLALMGPAAAVAYASLLPLHDEFKKELRQMGPNGASSCGGSSCGYSSGCGGGGGDSGGSGGCGGCGGGGD